jgi:DNA-binding GntR family transcriptional regulator
MQQTLLEMLRPHLLQLPWTPERQERTDRSHAAIYAALVAGDAAKVRAEMCEHLSMAYNSLLHDMQTPPTVSRARSQEVTP